MYKQEPPFSVQIEPVEGCPLRCDFCGLNGIRGKEHIYKPMSSHTAEQIANAIRDIGWNCRIEFAMHGEPTIHDELNYMITMFRDRLPKNYFLLTTNGYGFRRGAAYKITTLLEHGLDCIAIDRYNGITWSDLIKRQLLEKKIEVMMYPEHGNIANPHRREKKQRIVFLASIDITSKGTHGKTIFGNHCGAGAPLDFSAKEKRCARPFRELSFRWDGSVAICCNDWRGFYNIGNINDLTLEQLWQHPRFRVARKKLYQGQRDFGPCSGCNHKSYRVGFLPDKKGKQELGKCNSRDSKIIQEALSGKPLTEPIWRPWENEGNKST